MGSLHCGKHILCFSHRLTTCDNRFMTMSRCIANEKARVCAYECRRARRAETQINACYYHSVEHTPKSVSLRRSVFAVKTKRFAIGFFSVSMPGKVVE